MEARMTFFVRSFQWLKDFFDHLGYLRVHRVAPIFVALILNLETTPAVAEPFAYVANFFSNSVSVIDTATNTVVDTVPVGSNPFALDVTPDGAFVYVGNFVAGNVSVIDTTTNSVVATVNVAGHPNGVAVTPNGALVYVAGYTSDSVSVIDTATNTVVATVPVGVLPFGISISTDSAFAYVANGTSSSVSVIDIATNTVVATVPGLGHGTSLAVTPDGAFVYVTHHYVSSPVNPDPSVKVIDTSTYTVVDSVAVGLSPAHISITPDGNYIFVTISGGSAVSVIATASNTVVATVPVGVQPEGVKVTPDGAFAYVANSMSDSVSVIDTATNTVVATVPVGNQPEGVAIIAAPPALADHFLAYEVSPSDGGPKFETIEVSLTDEFEAGLFTVQTVEGFATPADKNDEGVADPDTHYVIYKIREVADQPPHQPITVVVSNQFGDISLDTAKVSRLLVPSAKDLDNPIEPLDPGAEHYKCYSVNVTKGTPKFSQLEVFVEDQFVTVQIGAPKLFEINQPVRLCNPVDKNGEGIVNPDNHLLCYQVQAAKGEPKFVKTTGVHTNNQFGPLQLDLLKEEELCVPSTTEIGG
jgi:YVTN family beta-propeller protein